VDRQAAPGAPARAEEVLRLLAAAANAVRLYPDSSPLRTQAIARFVEACESATGAAPVRYVVDRKRFVVAETAVGEHHPGVAALAETLHALQVGQLIIAPGVSAQEASAFLDVLVDDAKQVRASGGARERLTGAGVSNIAVVEVSLRASAEEGIAGVDLTAAPLDEIGRELPTVARRWYESAASGDGSDEMTAALQRLESASRDLAAQRVAQALLQLDERTRTHILAAALKADASGKRMDGMLDVVAKMSPAALARLLRLVGDMAGKEPGELAGLIELPPEAMRELLACLSPGAQSAEERGVPPEVDVSEIADEVAEDAEEDTDRIAQLVQGAQTVSPAGRALRTMLDVARLRPSPESVRALGEALPAALRAGAFTEAAEAVDVLSDLSADAGLQAEAAHALTALSAPDVLSSACVALATAPDTPGAAHVLAAAGSAGAEAVVRTYIETDEAGRVALQPVVAQLMDAVAPVASRVVRHGDATAAAAMVRLLGSLGDKRVMPTLEQALEHLDSQVRSVAIEAIAAMGVPESAASLQRALGHWDPETRRAAAAAIGRHRIRQAVPGLLRVLEDAGVRDRNHDLKKEVLRSVEALQASEAVPTLRKIAGRRFVFGRRNREIRYRAESVLAALEETAHGSSEGDAP